LNVGHEMPQKRAKKYQCGNALVVDIHGASDKRNRRDNLLQPISKQEKGEDKRDFNNKRYSFSRRRILALASFSATTGDLLHNLVVWHWGIWSGWIQTHEKQCINSTAESFGLWQIRFWETRTARPPGQHYQSKSL